MANGPDEKPKVADGKIPLWVKVMWALGVTWILVYIFLGLRHTITTWAGL
jgi:hypothetical protein